VFIAAVSGLALAIVSNASTVISKGGITPLDSINIFNGGVIGYWVGDLGVVPWIFIIIAAGLTARKAGLLSSIINALGAIVVVSLVIAVSIIALAASQQKELPVSEGPERSAFITNLLDSCVKRQQALPENKNLSTATLRQFCACTGNSLADVMTRTEFEYFMQNHMPSTSASEKMRAASESCAHIVRDARP
jgi:hypothetical protein